MRHLMSPLDFSVEELDKLEAFFAQFDFDIRLVRH